MCLAGLGRPALKSLVKLSYAAGSLSFVQNVTTKWSVVWCLNTSVRAQVKINTLAAQWGVTAGMAVTDKANTALHQTFPTCGNLI